jgi:hypothetical protein
MLMNRLENSIATHRNRALLSVAGQIDLKPERALEFVRTLELQDVEVAFVSDDT